MQVNHGKVAPLRRIHPHDLVVYYSPSVLMGGKDKLQSFTAIGAVQAAEPYQVDMGGGFVPYRRDVSWLPSTETPIAPLLETFEFSAGKRNWGYQLRFGLFGITKADIECIADAMGATLPS